MHYFCKLKVHYFVGLPFDDSSQPLVVKYSITEPFMRTKVGVEPISNVFLYLTSPPEPNECIMSWTHSNCIIVKFS